MFHRSVLVAVSVAAVAAVKLQAQAVRGDASATAVLAWFHADPTPERRALSEIGISQIMATGTLAWRRFHGRLTLNAEGATLPEGELAPGTWGEGFVDRRHPHTWVHELMLGVTHTGASLGGGLFAGKGFVPFGSDDPMGRPFIRFPVNHHLAQVLERAVLIGQVSAGPVLLEGAVFNGDEPESPTQWPRVARFGDSWSVRTTVRPTATVEATGSVARVASPEHRPGAGATQTKVHLGLRYERRTGAGRSYGLVEWARTEELSGVFVFRSLLAEGALRRGRHRISYRFERTDRPEEERLTPFRSARPHGDNSILGTTTWTLHTVGHAWRVTPAAARLAVATAVEATHGAVRRRGGGVFDVGEIYGTDRLWTLTVGLRVGWRGSEHRMGRYGPPGVHH
jgi:hypothetical protein